MGSFNRTSSGADEEKTDQRMPDDLLNPEQRDFEEILPETTTEQEGDSEASESSSGPHTSGGIGGGGTGSSPDRVSRARQGRDSEDSNSLIDTLLDGVLGLNSGEDDLSTDGAGIPPSKLESWTKKGPRETPRQTKDTLNRTLQRSEHLDREDIEFRVFLQGSYKNHTNIHGNSDVDIVIQLTSPHRKDSIGPFSKTSTVPNSDSSYTFSDFKGDVVKALREKYGHNAVIVDDKAIKIHAEDSTLKIDADVVVCQRYEPKEGESAMWFRSESGKEIVNHPQRHYKNGARKNQRTDGRYRETVRMFKRARTYLVNNGRFVKDDVPSYFLSCLLYNVPDEAFVGEPQERYVRVVNYLDNNRNELSSFMCQHDQHRLFGWDSTRWSRRDAEMFIDELIQLYQTWYN